jgi:predicted RNA methylase
MTQTSIEGAGTQRRELSQFFTPADLAERIVEWALHPYGELLARRLEVLEPSAGRGALVKPLLARGIQVNAFDIDPDNVRALCRLEGDGLEAQVQNFLEIELHEDGVQYDLAVMNPPFENGQAEAHILHALNWAERVVAHVPLTTFEGQARRKEFWSQVRLHRLAVCASRAKYGSKSGATAMCTIDVTSNGPAVGVCEWRDVTVEVWP